MKKGVLYPIWSRKIFKFSRTTGHKPSVTSPANAINRSRSEEHTSELQSHSDLHSFPTRRSSDLKGRFVSDLEQKDFQIFEDNRPQTIRYFTRERNQPVVIGFLLDLSNASRIHWKNFQDATIELIQNLLTGNPKYSGYLITYAQDAEVAVDTTSDPDPLVDKIRKLKPGGGSALYDAIYLACTRRKVIQGEPIEPRRVIVIIGDGHDNASKYTLNQVI